MKKTFTAFFALFFAANANAQHEHPPQGDTTRVLEEVVVMATAKQKIETEMKTAPSVDEFLASSDNISFIKRGAYAWEPLLNNMSAERSAITIDGMHVFGACTDKMDPVTAYVESNNLATIAIASGQAGSLHGAAIAGGIDLKRKSTPFGREQKWSGAYQTGFETNNRQFSNLGNVSYSGYGFAADGSLAFRKAGNYRAGNNSLVGHSQYGKLNASLGLAHRIGELSSVRLDAIYDRAEDTGFPALPMDLWLSRAVVTSAAYKRLFEKGAVRSWDAKLYFNAVEHYMDDTKRPENPVHMDMPGWSTTYGLTSGISLENGGYRSEVRLNLYDNLSIAEMTMYPQDRSRKTMFAYSWPGVRTRFAGFATDNSLEVSRTGKLRFGGSLGLHHNRSEHVEFNHIFYPGAPQEKTRMLPGLHASYEQQVGSFDFSAGAGYGHRAPSVSEGYGYYIYNSFDRYDYIGNPDLRNEVSHEISAGAGFRNGRTRIAAKANLFHVRHYIVGQILNMGSPMNYQSTGVKGYASLPYARLFNLTLNAERDILPQLHWNGTLAYARATDSQNGNLPFIRPLSCHTSIHFRHKKFALRTAVNGDFVQKNHSPEYGEDRTPAYAVWDASADYTFHFGHYKTVLQVGAENLLDRHYSTYADWGNIPRMGRNVFMSLKIKK